MKQKPWQRVLPIPDRDILVHRLPVSVLLAAHDLFKTPLAVSRGPKYMPYVDYTPTGEHWDYLFDEQRDALVRHFRNSFIAATGSTILAVIIGAMGGYGLARYSYHWRSVFGWRNNDIAFWIISQRFLPPALFVVPFLLIYSRLNLVDTHIWLDHRLYHVQYPIRRLDYARFLYESAHRPGGECVRGRGDGMAGIYAHRACH